MLYKGVKAPITLLLKQAGIFGNQFQIGDFFGPVPLPCIMGKNIGFTEDAVEQIVNVQFVGMIPKDFNLPADVRSPLVGLIANYRLKATMVHNTNPSKHWKKPNEHWLPLLFNI